MADETNEPDPSEPGASGASDGDTGSDTGAAASEKGTTSGADRAAAKRTGTADDAKGADTPKPVVKKKVVSKRVTPKGGATTGSTAAHAHPPAGEEASASKRYTPPSAKYEQMPSPTWVPVLMFALLGFGCLFIIANYARLFGDPENWRLLVGLGAILGGIITATNYR